MNPIDCLERFRVSEDCTALYNMREAVTHESVAEVVCWLAVHDVAGVDEYVRPFVIKEFAEPAIEALVARVPFGQVPRVALTLGLCTDRDSSAWRFPDHLVKRAWDVWPGLWAVVASDGDFASLDLNRRPASEVIGRPPVFELECSDTIFGGLMEHFEFSPDPLDVHSALAEWVRIARTSGASPVGGRPGRGGQPMQEGPARDRSTLDPRPLQSALRALWLAGHIDEKAIRLLRPRLHEGLALFPWSVAALCLVSRALARDVKAMPPLGLSERQLRKWLAEAHGMAPRLTTQGLMLAEIVLRGLAPAAWIE